MQGVRWILALLAALALIACGGSEKKYMLPVDSPAKPFVPPEADELVESDDGGWDLDDEDEADEAEDEANTASEPPAATTPKPTPGTATPPVAPTKPKKPAKATVTKPSKP